MNNFIDEFHKHYYDNMVWANTKWLGTQVLKLPFDLFLYQEIIYEIKPDVIIETGTFGGGSALFLASMLDLINNGKVITIDIRQQPNSPSHARITYLEASSTAEETIGKVECMIDPTDTVMVILDSDHSKNHVLNELKLYGNFVTVGSYLIVEDTNINGHPVFPDYGPGPKEAIDEFLQNNDQFIIDESKHKFLLTFNPRGFLQKIK